MFLRYSILIFFLFALSTKTFCGYVVEGKVNLNGNWQNEIYLATIDKLDDYYSANAKYIINTAVINKDGSFKIEGDNLPDQDQFYRLYLIKEEHSEFNACLFFEGDELNFIHLLLNNNSQLKIVPNPEVYAPFGDYQIDGDVNNILLTQLNRLIYPSYLFYEIKFPSELAFAENKLNKDLFNFADTCSNLFVSLAALINTNFDEYFDENQLYYESFYDKLKEKLRDHPYTENYLRKLNYHRNTPLKTSPSYYRYLSVFFFLLSIFLFYKYWSLKSSLGKSQSNDVSNELTIQERKVFDLIKEGKSNKEIASQLFIELSTVKSHINKIYSKLNIKSRKEAQTLNL